MYTYVYILNAKYLLITNHLIYHSFLPKSLRFNLYEAKLGQAMQIIIIIIKKETKKQTEFVFDMVTRDERNVAKLVVQTAIDQVRARASPSPTKFEIEFSRV